MAKADKVTGRGVAITIIVAVLQVAIGAAHGAITYIDAVDGTSGNTYATGGSLSDTSWVGPNASSGNALQWNKRFTVEGNTNVLDQTNTLYQGSTTNTSLPELTTEITGLEDGTYAIWAFYWDQVISGSQNWILSAGLTSGALTTYSSPGEPTVAGATNENVHNAMTLSFTTDVQVEAGFNGTIYLRNLFGIYLGEVTVEGGAAVNVYIDNNLHTGSGNRSWYDGVGYERIPIHEPITYVDAVAGSSGNTYATGGSLADTSWLEYVNSPVTRETNWVQRTGNGNSNALLQAIHTVPPNDLPELTTEITGLTDGLYALWAFYWDQTNSTSQNWALSAGLTSGSLASYSSPGEPDIAGTAKYPVYNASNLTFTSSIMIEQADGKQDLFGVYLGEVTVAGGSAVNVYINNNIGNVSFNRTWYDGVGYAALNTVTGTLLLVR